MHVNAVCVRGELGGVGSPTIEVLRTHHRSSGLASYLCLLSHLQPETEVYNRYVRGVTSYPWCRVNHWQNAHLVLPPPPQAVLYRREDRSVCVDSRPHWRLDFTVGLAGDTGTVRPEIGIAFPFP